MQLQHSKLSSNTTPPWPQVCLYAFDCLHLNGDTLIQRPLAERRAALYESIEEREGELLHAKTLVRAQPALVTHHDSPHSCTWTVLQFAR